MPAVTNHMGVLKNSEILVNGTDYANQMTRSRLTPDTPSQQLRTLVPDGTITDTDSASWVWEIAGIQKYATGGLAKLLNDATPGDLLTIVWEPRKDVTGQPTISFTVVAKPVTVGGDQGGFATFEAVLEVVGSPTFGTIA
jgi:hypothetical protein